MTSVQYITDGLEKAPTILKDLLAQIPEHLYKQRRVEGKWSIHEQVCHLAEAQEVLIGRLEQFEQEEHPQIRNYNPPVNRPESYYLSLDMTKELNRYVALRRKMITMLKGYSSEYWNKQGEHEGFEPYSSRLLLMHCLNVDYAHMFSIEQLGLTKPEFGHEIITIP
jgi:hypothetical protein